MFGLILIMSWRTKSIWFENIDPYKDIFHMNVESVAALSLILGFVAISLLVERAWCRWLCPPEPLHGEVELKTREAMLLGATVKNT